MKKYIILGCVATVTLFLCGSNMKSAQTGTIANVYAQQENVGASLDIVPVQKVESQDTIFGPVMLPEVIVNTKRKVSDVI